MTKLQDKPKPEYEIIITRDNIEIFRLSCLDVDFQAVIDAAKLTEQAMEKK